MVHKFSNYFLVLPASSWCVLRVRDKITLSTKGCAIFCLTFIVLLYLIAKHPISHLQKRLYSLRKRMILKKRYRLEVMHIFPKVFVVTQTKGLKEKRRRSFEQYQFIVELNQKEQGFSSFKFLLPLAIIIVVILWWEIK